MGLLQKKITDSGYEAEYWKIIDYQVDVLSKRASVSLGLFKDKVSADNGKQPIEIIRKEICDEEASQDGKACQDFTTYLAPKYATHENVYQVLYRAVKQIPQNIDLSKAQNVLEEEVTK